MLLLGALEPSLAGVERSLGRSWEVLVALGWSWGDLGVVLGDHGVILAGLGAILDRSWIILAGLGAILGRPWAGWRSQNH